MDEVSELGLNHEQRMHDGENYKKSTDSIGGQRNEGHPRIMERHTVTDHPDGSLGRERFKICVPAGSFFGTF